MSSVPIGSYVLVEVNPANYVSMKDYDSSNDGDIVPNTNMNNDTIPLTITNAENDANNYYIDAIACPLLVTNPGDGGYGTLRYMIDCAEDGDTIRFAAGMAGQTITINSTMLILDKDLVFLSTLIPTVTITSTINGLFDIHNGSTAEFRDLNIISGLSPGNTGAAFDNLGNLKLHNVNVRKNAMFPSGQYLIRNKNGSSMLLSGTCTIDMN